MGYFPFFVELKGKRGLIVGGGIVAERKVRKLLPYEPELLVVAPKIDDGIWKLSEEIKEKRKKNEDTSELILSERDFETTDLEKMDFVIAATSDEALNARIAKLCEERNILVNVVDDKEKCGFLFPSLIREGKLSIGISTEGASPRVATTFRARLSADIPDLPDDGRSGSEWERSNGQCALRRPRREFRNDPRHHSRSGRTLSVALPAPGQ